MSVVECVHQWSAWGEPDFESRQERHCLCGAIERTKSMRELHTLVAENLELFDRLSSAWDGLTEEQQIALTRSAEWMKGANDRAEASAS